MPRILPPRSSTTLHGTLLLAVTLIAAIGCLPGCVPSAQHQQAVDERDRLRRENTELRKRLTEETVRRQEAHEAMRRMEGLGGSAAAMSPALRPAGGSADPGASNQNRVSQPPARGSSATPEAVRARADQGGAGMGGGAITEEDLQGTSAANPDPPAEAEFPS